MKKKILFFSIAIIILLSIIIIGIKSTSSLGNANISTQKEFKTYEEVEEEYNKNLEKLMNNEQIRRLDSENIVLENILEYANKSEELSNGIESYSKKIRLVEQLVSLDDLEHNTTLEAIKDTIRYVISEYENNNYTNNLLQFLYLTKYLDKVLDNYSNMEKANEMVFDMYQIAKDTIRVNDPNFEENLKNDLFYSIEANKKQINKYIVSVKESLN